VLRGLEHQLQVSRGGDAAGVLLARQAVADEITLIC